jgi:ribosomal protein L7/L12
MPDPEQEILDLVAAGRKIQAIKLVREHLGMGLAEAKAFVEDLQERGDGGGRPWPPARKAGAPAAGAGQAASARATAGAGADPFDHEIDHLLRSRKKLEAVKLYRQRVGGDLKDAKDAIERRAVEIGLQSRPSKCFIATAAWGGGEQAEVVALRRFRNRVLKRAWWGRVVISVYERVSPPLAWAVARSEVLAWCVRTAVRAAR